MAPSDEKKVKKAKKAAAEEEPAVEAEEEEAPKKKRSSKKAAAEEEEAPKPKKKKRQTEEEPPGAEEAEAEAAPPQKKKKSAVAAAAAAEPVAAADDDPGALDKFRLSPAIKARAPHASLSSLASGAHRRRRRRPQAKLLECGVKALFPIQAQTFDHVLDGHDVIARARTGQGKTLAFVLPILEVLAQASAAAQSGAPPYPARGRGRPPRVIVLAPTRELAKQARMGAHQPTPAPAPRRHQRCHRAAQVAEDFSKYGSVLRLATCCVYGGASFQPQESALRGGVDVVVGTPGRIKDFIERKTLDLSALRFRVLDEMDVRAPPPPH